MTDQQASIIIAQQQRTIEALERFQRSVRRAFWVRAVLAAILLYGVWRMADFIRWLAPTY